MINDESFDWDLNDIFVEPQKYEDAKDELKRYSERLLEFQGKLRYVENIAEFYELKEKVDISIDEILIKIIEYVEVKVWRLP